MESEDYSFFKNLDWLLENNVEDLGSQLTFSTEIQEFGVGRSWSTRRTTTYRR